MFTGNKNPASANRRKCLSYIIAGIILQMLIMLVFVLIFLRIRNPKVRFRALTVENIIANSPGSPSFSMKLSAQVTVKNTNFGHFKFPDSPISIFYKGTLVGESDIPKRRAKARSTEKMNITISVDSKKVSSSSTLIRDINSGKIPLSGNATLHGKVHLLEVIKKKKTAKMDCTMDVNIKAKTIENLKCI
ncbi:late embryogenesis abundant At1g64065-like [Olea europaea subsp. europaea]|uniref:Late embryogenesis abundant At1g64065-like n=1 Tax=Olea europaea subsp. europaea TaxID=158383 RepID=A0A8S0R4X5_OLEEU|nr:late embryogenesis abundant At1g64065-like [Olea europaea subsp. europaea]